MDQETVAPHPNKAPQSSAGFCLAADYAKAHPEDTSGGPCQGSTEEHGVHLPH